MLPPFAGNSLHCKVDIRTPENCDTMEILRNGINSSALLGNKGVRMHDMSQTLDFAVLSACR
jgi:hypothetical protein